MTVTTCPSPATDASHRYVLADDAPYLANLAALWTVEPKLAEAIEAIDDAEVYPTEPSKAGVPTVVVKTADGRSLYLHSRYQPLEEAKRQVDAVDLKQTVFFYLLGFGLGYIAENLFDRASDEATLVVFEPDLRLLRTAFAARDLSKLVASNRVMFVTQADKPDLFRRLNPHTAVVSIGTETIAHAVSKQLHPAFYAQVEAWLGEFAAFGRTNMNTLVINSRKTAENISKNIGWYAASPGIGRLKDRYKKSPAVIVSAGPSLRKNKHLLKGLEDRAVIIAVQTTLQPLLETGIEPHYVTSLDWSEICSRFYENLPPMVKTELIAEPKATNVIFDLFPGPASLVGTDFAESLLREMNLNKPTLTSGATVAHLAYYLAEHLGCDPIIFIGQDLGFGEGLCYSPGTSYEDVWRPELSRFCTVEMKQWEQIVRERHILRKIPDYQGRPMYTEERLFTYLQQFERDFAQSKATLIDATEGGALKRGTTSMPLAAAIERFCGKPLPAIVDPERGAMRWERAAACVRSLEARRDEAAEMEKISRQTLPLLEEVRDHLGDHARVNRVIARIDELRARMDAVGRTYGLVTQLTQSTELKRFEQDRKLTAAKLEGVEKQRWQIARDIDNVNAMIGAARDFQALMLDVIALVRSQAAAFGRKEAA